MQARIEIVDPLAFNDWNDRLADVPAVSIFHSRNWAQVLQQAYHYRPVYFCTLTQGRISSLMPLMEVDSILTGRRGVSLPFTDFCEPLISNGTELGEILDQMCDHGKNHRWKWFQLRGGDCHGTQADQQYLVHDLPLEEDSQKLFANIRSAKRRNIRKAQTQQLEIELKDDLQSMDSYYTLHCRTRKRHGVPPQPRRFFQSIYENIIAQGLGKIFLARHQQQAVAASIFFHFRKKALYKFGASDMAFQHLRANDLLMWEAIKWYAEQGFETFSFGRTSPDNTGLRRFKADWGAQETTVNYYRYDLRRHAFVASAGGEKAAHQNLFRWLPVSALKAVGSVLYKHMG